MNRLSPGFYLLPALLGVAACEGDVFPIRAGEPVVTTPEMGSGGSESASGGGMGGKSASGGAPPSGGTGGAGEPGRTTPIWSAPVKLSFSDGGENEQDPSMSPDGLELYFTSGQSGGVGKIDIFRVTRANVDDPWGTPEAINSLNSVENEAGPFVGADGLSIWFARSDGTSFYIFEAKRPTINDAWGAPTVLPGLAGDLGGIAPCVTADGLTLFLSDNSEDLDVDVYRATRVALTEPFGGLVPLDALNSAGNDWDAMSQDDLLFLFNRDGDLFSSVRSAVGAPFGPIEALDELNSPESDTDPWLSIDGKTLLFGSNRSGTHDLYEAHRD